MPTYEYKCNKCKKLHEVFQSITAEPLTQCPNCSGKLKRLMGGGSGFIFKGSGFYITDYRSKSYQEAKKKDLKDQKDQKSESSSSSESKPKKDDKPKKADKPKE